jgi:hypothetical protein
LSNSDTPATFGVVLFQSVHGAIGAERVLLAAGVAHKLIPVPRHLSSNCGFCLRFDWSMKDIVEQSLGQASLGVERIVAL